MGWELDDDVCGEGSVRKEIVSLVEGLAEVQIWDGLCYALSRGTSGPRIRVRSRSSGVWGRVGRGFSKRVTAPTRLSCLVFSEG